MPSTLNTFNAVNMHAIAAYMVYCFNNNPVLRDRVIKASEPFRSLVWNSGVFDEQFLDKVLDPMGGRTPEMLAMWEALMEALEQLMQTPT